MRDADHVDLRLGTAPDACFRRIAQNDPIEQLVDRWRSGCPEVGDLLLEVELIEARPAREISGK